METIVARRALRDGSDDYSVMPVTVGDQPQSYH